MNDQIRIWDERFGRGEELHGYEPSSPLATAVANVPPGLALDLASGAGRHALWLAEHGWRVHAIDGSRVGTERMLREAERRGVAERIESQIADLEAPDFAIPADAYDLVCDFYFLHRPLFAQIRRAVRPGGRFVAALHVRGSDSGRFLLEPGELLSLIQSWSWNVEWWREGDSQESGHRHGTTEIVARRPDRPT